MTNNELHGLTIKQAAKVAGISDRTMRKLVHRGEVPCFKVGDQWRILSNFIETLAAKQGKEKVSAEA